MSFRVEKAGAFCRRALLPAGLMLGLMLSLGLGAVPAQAEDTIPPEYREAAEELFTITDVENTTLQMTSMMVKELTPAFSQANPGKEHDVVKVLMEEFTLVFAEMMPAFKEEMLKIYYKHFNLEDIEALLAFYKTPTGVKYIERMPQLTEDCFAMGSAFGRQIGTQAYANIIRRVQEMGLNAPKTPI